MHRNPVKRGLVESPELWRWSSFRAYALGEAGPVRINQWEVLKMKVRPPGRLRRSPLLEKREKWGTPNFLLCQHLERAPCTYPPEMWASCRSTLSG
jgi:hypothetical protein